jgi:hypothetical protein
MQIVEAHHGLTRVALLLLCSIHITAVASPQHRAETGHAYTFTKKVVARTVHVVRSCMTNEVHDSHCTRARINVINNNNDNSAL